MEKLKEVHITHDPQSEITTVEFDGRGLLIHDQVLAPLLLERVVRICFQVWQEEQNKSFPF